MARGVGRGTFNKSKQIVEWLLALVIVGLLLLGLYALGLMVGIVPVPAVVIP